MITVRRFNKSDVREIMTLFYETVHSVNARDYSAEQVDAWAPFDMDYDRWVESLSSRITFVAESDSIIVGFAELEETGHIDRFYCHKDYQRVGIGAELVSAVEEEAHRRNIPRLFAEVSITAKPFFTSMGFVVLEEQTVTTRGVAFINYRMEKVLIHG
jgi:putative acetyltransferase